MSAVFHARGMSEPAVTRLDRETACAGYRVFRARDGLEVAIPEHLVERGIAHCRRVRPLEWYGSLVATRHEDDLGRHIVIRGLVLDPDAKATSSRVESTFASEAVLRRVAALYYPDAHVIGWCHGHPPRIGAFYSSTDRENQSSWGDPDAIGIVFEAEDPKQLAVFRGPKSEELMLARDESRPRATRSISSTATVAAPAETTIPPSPADAPPAQATACVCGREPLELARRALRLALVATVMGCLSPVATLLAARGVTESTAVHGSIGTPTSHPPAPASTVASPASAAESVTRDAGADAGGPNQDASFDPLDGAVEPMFTHDAAASAVEVPDAAFDAPRRRPRSRAPRRRPAPPDRVADQP